MATKNGERWFDKHEDLKAHIHETSHFPPKPTHRNHNPWHDYHEACIYHITLVCSDRVPVLGKIVGESVEKAHVVFTPLGKEVAHAIQDIPYKEFHKGNDVQILAAVTMPEHLHFVLYVRKPMKEKMGTIIRGFKQGCNKALRRWLERAGMYIACIAKRWLYLPTATRDSQLAKSMAMSSRRRVRRVSLTRKKSSPSSGSSALSPPLAYFIPTLSLRRTSTRHG